MEKHKETTQAKIRNRLGTYKNLIKMILGFDNLPENKKTLVMNLMKEAATNADEGFDELLELVDATALPDEYILCAAIWYKELPLRKEEPLRLRGMSPYNVDCGVVLCGWRHPNPLYQMVGITGLRDCEAGESVQGFLTNKNRFVDRIEGMKIATNANQLATDMYIGNELFSENLY